MNTKRPSKKSQDSIEVAANIAIAILQSRVSHGNDEAKKELDLLKTRYPALGVLCELAVKHGIISKPSSKVGVSYYYYGDEKYDVQKSWLPNKVREWAGMATRHGAFTRLPKTERWGFDHNSISELNDESRMPFNQLAGVIENYGQYL